MIRRAWRIAVQAVNKNQFSFLKPDLVGRAELQLTSVVTPLSIQRQRKREFSNLATNRFTEEDKR
jgi:hypothetical protein